MFWNVKFSGGASSNFQDSRERSAAATIAVMALHLGSRSVQLSRLVLQACRPAGIACLDIRRVLFAARASATVQTDGDCAVVERQQPANPKVGSCFGFLPARRLPASSFGNLPGGISAAHFCTFGESAAALEKGREDRDNKEQGAGRAVEQKDRGLRKPLRPCEWREEMILRGELLQCLREWSPDADLNQKLPSGTISGKPIDVTSLRAVLFSLAKAPKRDKGVDTPGEANEEAGRAPGESKYQYSEKGALQALNALEWWLSRNREDPCRSVDLLFHPVLEALSGARLTDAIAGMWDR